MREHTIGEGFAPKHIEKGFEVASIVPEVTEGGTKRGHFQVVLKHDQLEVARNRRDRGLLP